MAHFYGKVEGNKGEASRLGTKKSGMETYCASWKGAIRCYAWVDTEGVDMVRVEKVQWRGVGESKLLYEGPIGHAEGLPEQFGKPEEEVTACVQTSKVSRAKRQAAQLRSWGVPQR